MHKTQPYALQSFLKLLLASPTPGVAILSLKVGWALRAVVVGPVLELLGFPPRLLWVTCLAGLEIPFYSLQKCNQRVGFPLKFIYLSKANFSYRDQLNMDLIINLKSLFLVCDMIMINSKSLFLVCDMIMINS